MGNKVGLPRSPPQKKVRLEGSGGGFFPSGGGRGEEGWGDVQCGIPGKPGTKRPISLWLPTYGSVNPLLRRAPVLSVFHHCLKKEIASLITLSVLWKELHSWPAFMNHVCLMSILGVLSKIEKCNKKKKILDTKAEESGLLSAWACPSVDTLRAHYLLQCFAFSCNVTIVVAEWCWISIRIQPHT